MQSFRNFKPSGTAVQNFDTVWQSKSTRHSKTHGIPFMWAYNCWASWVLSYFLSTHIETGLPLNPEVTLEFSSVDIWLTIIMYIFLSTICPKHSSLQMVVHCSPNLGASLSTRDGFNIKMSSYQYRKSHCGDKTIIRSSYLHNGNSYTGKTAYIELGPKGW